jgi:CheY-like chemotaxis protein
MKRILIVDDEKEVRDIYEEFILHNLGHNELTFSVDGIEAYIKCSLQKFDTIMLDHKMPRLNGLNLLIALRNKPGLNQFTPVIIISGFLPEIEKGELVFENTFFLQKPFSFEDLSKCLKISLK